VVKIAAVLPLHNLAYESTEGVDEFSFSFVRFDPQIPPYFRRPNHSTCYIVFMNEDKPITVGFCESGKDASSFLTDTEIVPKKWNDKRGGIATPSVFDTLGHCIYIIRIHIDVESQKCVYTGCSSKLPLYSPQECLCFVDVGFIPEELPKRSRKIVDIDLSALLFAQDIVEVERLVRTHQIKQEAIVFDIPQPISDLIPRNFHGVCSSSKVHKERRFWEILA
jgi:hypothetical protein